MCSVYIICHAENGVLKAPVKVGISSSPLGRLGNLQTASPHLLEMGYWFQFPDRNTASQVEDAFHKVYAEKALQGEWFAMRPRDALLGMCANIRAYLKWLGMDDELYSRAIELSGVEEAEEFLERLDVRNTIQ